MAREAKTKKPAGEEQCILRPIAALRNAVALDDN